MSPSILQHVQPRHILLPSMFQWGLSLLARHPHEIQVIGSRIASSFHIMYFTGENQVICFQKPAGRIPKEYYIRRQA